MDERQRAWAAAKPASHTANAARLGALIRSSPLRHPGHAQALIDALAPKKVVRIVTHQCAGEIVALTAPATLFKTDKSSRSADPQQRTKAPRCKLTRGARGCEPAPRTPLLLSYGTELSSARPCSAGVGRDVRTNHGEGGAFAPRSDGDGAPVGYRTDANIVSDIFLTQG